MSYSSNEEALNCVGMVPRFGRKLRCNFQITFLKANRNGRKLGLMFLLWCAMIVGVFLHSWNNFVLNVILNKGRHI